ncbi:MAG TPA: hypothetical protein ENG49_01355 [Candidatus Omnitrophica bacterium]|nr:hypothetical protein [Candidatus Omnitrophota bacterium]
MNSVINFCLLLLISQSFAQTHDLSVLKGAHFIIYYAPEVSERYVEKVKEEAEDLYRMITQEFFLVREHPWIWEDRGKILIAKDKRDYEERFGCPLWSGACVDYKGKAIYTYPGQENFPSILCHELTHIILREYIERMERLPLWFDEGVAMYTEFNYSSSVSFQHLVDSVEKLIKRREYIEFSQMEKLTPNSLKGKSPYYVKNFYLQAWSMINFLIERFGEVKFREFLSRLRRHCDFKEALFSNYGLINNYQDFERLWKKFYLE